MRRFFLVLPFSLSLLIGACFAPGGGATSDDDDDPASDDDDGWWDDDDAADDDDAMSDDDDVTWDDDDDDDPTKEEEFETCDDADESVRTQYVSADDSNSMGAAALRRSLLLDHERVNPGPAKAYEFLNYYEFDYAPAPAGTLSIVPELVENPDVPGDYDMLVGLVSEEMPNSRRKPVNLVFSIDTSCSMQNGGLQVGKAVMNTIAAGLDSGDVVSLVKWSDNSTVTLDSHMVGGPSDPLFLEEVAALSSSGSTNLDGGLAAAYTIANANHTMGRTSRVILISDGGANVGTTNADLIATNAEDGELEGIYLMGVGTPRATDYNGALMDSVTDLGRGAYLYVDSIAEAEARFAAERLPELLEVAARDVQLSISLPPGFVVDDFSGEEISTEPGVVTPQHIAPNGRMLYDVDLLDCSIDASSAEYPITFSANWTDPLTGLETTKVEIFTVAELLAAEHARLDKAGAIVAYAQAYSDIAGITGTSARRNYLEGVLAVVSAVADAQPDDQDLADIVDILTEWRAMY